MLLLVERGAVGHILNLTEALQRQRQARGQRIARLCAVFETKAVLVGVGPRSLKNIGLRSRNLLLASSMIGPK